ncbi:MAG: coproporphyrinogen dehydrogenase HemZ [Lachnospiraceae bacterium]|nr:coproporphyrinogen dehydrogenase HemZ [Lachnospiraceae bacterium]
MIQFEIKKNTAHPGEFSYDLKALALSFFPEQECQVAEREDWRDKTGYPARCQMDGQVVWEEDLPEGYTKNQVKVSLYRAFADISGRRLPWGILTGIRPVKIPLRMKMAGKSKEEIRDCLREEYLVGESKISLALAVAEREYELTRSFSHERGYNVYIGIPFCPSICQYCSFSSYDYVRYENRVEDYLAALEKEMRGAGRDNSRELHTIYVGGGTPTSLTEKQLGRLMEMIHAHLPVEQALEFTVEAGRPDSITREKLRILKEAGVTRVSINPQTMKQHTLDLLGRRHRVEQVAEAFHMAREAGFDNINMDLIVGLPEEDEVDFFNTLNRVCELEPDSITVHTLVIKRAGRLRRKQLEQGGGIQPEDTLIPVLQRISGEYLQEKGYEPYYMYRQKNKAGTTRNTNQENVAYARPGKECLYNIFIMEELETIVALGSGGATKQVFHGEDRMERIENVKSVEDYIARIDEMIERKRAAGIGG